MPKYSLAICAATVLIHENDCGERSVLADSDWCLRTGDLDDLGETYELYQRINGIPDTRAARHPLGRNAAVRSSIANTNDGRELFRLTAYLNYPGISNAWGRVFELGEKWRWESLDEARERAAERKLDTREKKLLECLTLLYNSHQP